MKEELSKFNLEYSIEKESRYIVFYQYFSIHSREQNRTYLAAYLKDFGYDNALQEIFPYYEHEERFYYKADAFFIKITPIISQEIQHMHQLNFPFILPTLFGTSAKDEILITPTISNPHFMTEQVDRYIAGQLTVEAFLSSELEVLKRIVAVNQSESFPRALFPSYNQFLSYAWGQLKKVPLLEMPIVFEDRLHPSIKEMVEKALAIELAPIKGYRIHGEFSHTHVGIDGENFIIYDWEKMTDYGDPCWDLANWVKYFNYFNYLEKVKKNPDLINENFMWIVDNKIVLKRAVLNNSNF